MEYYQLMDGAGNLLPLLPGMPKGFEPSGPLSCSYVLSDIGTIFLQQTDGVLFLTFHLTAAFKGALKGAKKVLVFSGPRFRLHDEPVLSLSLGPGSTQMALVNVPAPLLQRLRDHFTIQPDTMLPLESSSLDHLHHLTQAYLADPRIQAILHELRSGATSFYRQLKREELLMAAMSVMVRADSNIVPENSVRAKAIQAAVILQERIAAPPSLDELVRIVMSNRSSLQDAFKKEYNTTIQRYSQKLRLVRAKELLLDPSLSLNDIAEETGYEFGTNLSKEFKKYFGYTPREWRMGMRVGV